MILVREVFICKPGLASKFAKLMKSVMQGMPERVTVMTDLTGQFNKVVLHSEYKSFQDFESRMKDYATNTVWRDKMAGYTEMYVTGQREIYQICE
ncbi:MAG: hypothetical protein HYZ51_01450 [Candidatus Doudnabacteria bacterium]|nr:hypothetical protein [Candidatus Doudnabacteria bacterium]